MSYGRKIKQKPTLLWIGDAVAHTGFATVTHGVLDHLHKSWNVHVLGINYYGDPHEYNYSIWPAFRPNGDMHGLAKPGNVLKKTRPNIVCILNDPWSVGDYIRIIKEYNAWLRSEYKKVAETRPDIVPPVTAKIAVYTPVDAANIKSMFVDELNKADLVVAYTEFGLRELTISGLSTESSVVPHGIDTKTFYPMDKAQARSKLNLPEDWYIVGLVNRN